MNHRRVVQSTAPAKYETKASSYITRIVIIVAILTVLQLFRWQVLSYERFSSLATAQVSQSSQIFTKRGTITTADGVPLAVDSPSWDVVISLTNSVDQKKFLPAKTPESESDIKKSKTYVFEKLADILDENPEVFEKTFDSQRLSYQVIYKGINKRQRDILVAEKLHGVYTEESVKRLYPNGELFSHVIGYVGTDSYGRPKGNYGIEGFFWGDIKGKEGETQQEKDLSGKAIISTQYKNVQYREGKNIELTVNSGIQKKIEKILEEGVIDQQGDSGTVIIMNPKTGEIVAMAVYPRYDPNEFWKVSDIATFRNKAVAGTYEYGSVQKPLTIAMALQEGTLTENDICNDTGALKVDDKVIYNFNYAKYGKITPKETLQHSDNVCAATYGLSIGAQKMHDYLVKLGIGAQTSIGIAEEETSLLRPADRWLNIDTATVSFGQTVSATPLQVISALSSLANHGERMQPMLVKRIYNNEDSIDINPTSAGRVFTPEVTEKTVAMMQYAIMSQRDMAKYRGVYDIAGKTGTAQVAKKDASGYDENIVNVTFVGFAPATDARFIMLVKIENPKKGGLANLTVLPLWIRLFDTIKDDLGVPRIK